MSNMKEMVSSIIIKGNLIIFLISMSVSILFYMDCADILKSLLVFCITYIFVYSIHKLISYYIKRFELKKRIKNNDIIRKKQTKEIENTKKVHSSTIYESLPDEAKRALISLYRLPKLDGGYYNARILDEKCMESQKLSNTIFKYSDRLIGYNGQPLIFSDVSNIALVYIDQYLYQVLEEKSKTFEM